MWTRGLFTAILLLIGSGCAETITLHAVYQPAYDAIGPATLCEWENKRPYNCVRDPKRATINLEYFNDFLDELQRCLEDEFNRRKL